MIGTIFTADSADGATAEETVLRIGFMQKVDSLNPNIGLADASRMLYGLVYDCLMTVDEDLSSTSNLALGWGVAEDFEPYGSAWDYNLTQHALWHDGEPFTADDVAFTFNLNCQNYVTMWAYQPYAYYMSYAEVINDHTVRVHFFDRATADPMAVAFGSSMFIPILPKHLMSSMTPTDISFNWPGVFEGSNPPIVGTGPFMATEAIHDDWLVGDKLTLVKNPYYHWKTDKPGSPEVKFDKLELHFFNDATAMALALEIGDLDVARFPPREYTTLKNKVEGGTLPNIETYDGPTCTQYWTHILINFNNAGPNPSRLDPVIRQAMAMATNKEYINDNHYLGLGAPGSTLISPVNEEWHYEPMASELYVYDLEAANELLEAGGYRYTAESPDVRVCTSDSYAYQAGLVPEGTPLTYEMALRHEYPEEKDIAIYLQWEWAKIGIEINYALMTEAALGAVVYGYSYDTAMWCWWSDPDPNYMLFCQSKAAWHGWSDNMYYSPEYDENYTRSVRELDVAMRQSYVDGCQREHYRDVGYIILDYVSQTYAWRTDTFSGWGDWEANPGRSIDAFWGGNPLYFDLTPAGYVPPEETCVFVSSAELNGTEGENGWYVSDVTVTLDAFSLIDDTVAPITSATVSGTSGDNGWFLSPVTVELTAYDDFSGVSATYYSIDDGAWSVYSTALDISGEGAHDIAYYSVDEEGNEEHEKTVSANIDLTSPTLSIDLFDGHEFSSPTASIDLSSYDDVSGIWYCERSLDGGDYAECAIDHVVLTGLSEGNHTLDVRAYDEAGNAAEDSVWFLVNIILPGTNRSVDYLWYDMFGHPIGEHYDWRANTSQDEWRLTNEFPYLYMWEGPPPGNTYIHTFSRLNVTGSDMPELSMNANPEFLPYLGTTRGGTAVLDWHMDYLTYDEADAKLSEGAMSWFDGWFCELMGNTTLDEQAAKTVLGITDQGFDDFETWWTANGLDVKLAWKAWMIDEASNDRLAIYNAYDYDLQFLYFELDADKVGDEVVVTFDAVSWGAEALMFRWLREAFMPTEWYMEDMHLSATIGPETADMHFDAAVQYALYAYESVEDGTPCWVWEAMLQDYIESTLLHPYSDFDPYADLDYLNRAPGSDWYGSMMPYDYTPGAWNLLENETLTFEWPEEEVWFFAHDIDELGTGTIVDGTLEFLANMTVQYAEPMPSDFSESITIDEEARQICFTGPIDMWTWSHDQIAHEWLSDEWDRLGILPYGVPLIEFRPSGYGTALSSAGDDDPDSYASPVLASSALLDHISYRVDDGEWQTYVDPFVISEDGVHTLERYCVDSEGNEEDVRTLEIKIDKTAPELTMTTADGAEFRVNDVNISWVCEDVCSGVYSVEYSVDGGAFVDCADRSWAVIPDLSVGDHEVTISVWDYAGNEEIQTLSITVESGDGGISSEVLTLGLAGVLVAVAVLVLAVYLMRRRKPKSDGPSGPT
ncbi:MAG: hypothetical protein JSV90_09345 [Methanobacteriota archaeon]|nr:MAG: hypothetical protein JSV90_09345 [Euryarchaeota archaeon]